MLKNLITQIFKDHLKTDFSEREIHLLARIYYEDKVQGNYSSIIELDTEIKSDLADIVEGKPIQYIVGKAYFYDGFFQLNDATLIPRPETEELVHWIIQDHHVSHPKILDIGTGSGCIAISVMKQIPGSEVHAIDLIPEALEIARINASTHQVNITFRKADFLDETQWLDLGSFDIIVSNPPYIAWSEKDEMSKSTLAYEPASALFPESSDSLIFYKKIAAFGKTYLKDKGVIFLELNEFHALEINEVFLRAGYSSIELKEDLQGKLRMAKILK